jgi:hypothetical protein
VRLADNCRDETDCRLLKIGVEINKTVNKGIKYCIGG